MQSVKERMAKVVDQQPDDASYEEIIKELAFERMVIKGLEESRQGQTISNEKMKKKISNWQK